MPVAVRRSMWPVVAVLAAISAQATAQQPVWVHSPVNGHWYALTPPSGWTQASLQAQSWGATLVTVRSDEEGYWLGATLGDIGSARWTGLYQDTADPAYSEPAGAWKWMSGEPVNYTKWGPNEPNNLGGGEDFATVSLDGYFNDISPNLVVSGIAEVVSDDCNADGIPDAYQIHVGLLSDLDEDGSPDICESVAHTNIALRSGSGQVGEPDAAVTVEVGPPDSGFVWVFGPPDFSEASLGPAALIVSPDPSWMPSLPSDSQAKWISTPSPGSSALYAVTFDLSSAAVLSASLSVWFSVDNVLGEGGNEGLFLNGQPIPQTKWQQSEAYKAQASFTALDVGSLVVPGKNTLYLYAKDEGGPAGIIFSATIDVGQELADPWEELGSGLAGSTGVPVLVGTGNLLPSSPLTLTLSSTKPFSPAYLVVGLSDMSLPFKGGVMVPHPDLVFPTFTDGVGGESFAALWPAGVPSGFETFMQFWIVDVTGPLGFAASNGLAATSP